MDNFNSQIDSFQEEKLKDTLLGEETLSQDILNRQIDEYQKNIDNDVSLNQQEKLDKKAQLLVFLEWMNPWNIWLSDVVGFFDSISESNQPISKAHNIKLPYVDRNGLPVLGWFDEETSVEIDKKVKEIIGNNQYSNSEKIDWIYNLYAQYGNKYMVLPQDDIFWDNWIIGLAFEQNGINLSDIPWGRERMILWPVLSESLKNPSIIATLRVLERKSTSELIELFWDELGTDALYKIQFLHLNQEERIQLLLQWWDAIRDLKINWLSLPKDILLYSKSKEIQKKKWDINTLINNCTDVKVRQGLIEIHLALNNSLKDSNIWALEYLSSLEAFEESLLDELWSLHVDHIKNINDITSLLSKNSKLLPFMNKIKSAKILVTKVYYDLDIKETGMYLSTFIPWWVWNGLDLSYWLYALNTWKSAITWEIINKQQAMAQIIISMIGLGFDLVSGWTLWIVAKWLLKWLSKWWKVSTELKVIIDKMTSNPLFQNLLQQTEMNIKYMVEAVKKITVPLADDLILLNNLH